MEDDNSQADDKLAKNNDRAIDEDEAVLFGGSPSRRPVVAKNTKMDQLV